MGEETYTIEDVARRLDETGMQYLATVGLDGRPKVRPVQYMVVRGGRLWFCTNREKALYAELRNSPFVDLCASRLQADELTTTWIRFSAEAEFPPETTADEREAVRGIKQAIIEKSAIVRELYGADAGHPLLAVFSLKNVRGSMNNLGHVTGLPERSDFARPVSFALCTGEGEAGQ